MSPTRRRTPCACVPNELDYDREAADWHARQRARLVAAGQTPTLVDGQIAAIACVNDLIIVTSNTRDFQDFQGLRVEHWA